MRSFLLFLIRKLLYYVPARWYRSQRAATKMFSRKDAGHPSDRQLLNTVLALMTIGLVMVYASSVARAGRHVAANHDLFFKTQLQSALIGLIAMYLISRLHHSIIRSLASFGLLLGIALLIATYLFGVQSHGARRWLVAGPLRFQSSELIKIVWINYIALYLSRPEINPRELKLRQYGWLLLPLLIISAALGLQPDFGSIVICATLFGGLLYLAGVPFRHLLIPALVIPPIAFFVLSLKYSHLTRRISEFQFSLFGEGVTSYNLKQALIGFGRGNWFGVGLGQSHQKMDFLPEAHTDFIFDIYGEEFGFAGVLALVGLYIYFLLRGMQIARNASGEYEALLCAGLVCSISFQSIVNMCMAIGVLPTKGLTLPFISYGGSSLLITCCATGVILGISRRREPGKFDRKCLYWLSLISARLPAWMRDKKTSRSRQVAYTQLEIQRRKKK